MPVSYKKVPAAKVPPTRKFPNVGRDLPGIGEDETIVQLDSGEIVAVKVVTEFLPNSGGVAFRPIARVINLDGSTVEENGQPVVTETSITFDAVDVDTEAKIAALKKDAVLLVLGEEPILTRDVLEEDGTKSKKPMMRHVDPGSNIGSSIKHHIKINKAIKANGKVIL